MSKRKSAKPSKLARPAARPHGKKQAIVKSAKDKLRALLLIQKHAKTRHCVDRATALRWRIMYGAITSSIPDLACRKWQASFSLC
jgi:hypothetical protein